jgi:hypothetical protein
MTVAAPTLSAHFTGLTNGESYTFTVMARNAIGDSHSSPNSNTVTPFGEPGQVTGVTAAYGDGTVTISWQAAAANGNTPHYNVVGTAPEAPGTVGPLTTSGLQMTFTTLPHCVPWSFTVTAENDAGVGTSSNTLTGVVPAASQTVVVGNTAYNPQNINSPELCRRVTYTFPVSAANTRSHSVTDFLKLGQTNKAPLLFDSGLIAPGGPSFTYLFQGAGYYSYQSTGKNDIYTGAVGFPVVVTPNSGSKSGTYDVRWGYRMAPWLVVNIDFQFLKTGGKTWPNSWTNWKKGVTTTHDSFNPSTNPLTLKNGAGTYRFRATMTNPTTGRSSAPSADLPISYLTVS